MKCLSIQQPWADLILGRITDEHEGLKDVENRTWDTRYRGPLLIHTGKSIDREAMEYMQLDYPPATGVILGRVDLVDIVKDSRSVWAMDGQFHWVLRNPVIFDNPIQWRGQLGLFDIPEVILNLSWVK